MKWNRCPFIHSFHFLLPLILQCVEGVLEPFPAVLWGRQGYTLNKLPLYYGFHRRSKNIQSRVNSPSPKSPHPHEAGAPGWRTRTNTGLRIKPTSSLCVVTMLTAAPLCHTVKTSRQVMHCVLYVLYITRLWWKYHTIWITSLLWFIWGHLCLICIRLSLNSPLYKHLQPYWTFIWSPHSSHWVLACGWLEDDVLVSLFFSTL